MIYAFTGLMGDRCYPWYWYGLLMVVQHFQHDAGKTVLESIRKGGPGLFNTGKALRSICSSKLLPPGMLSLRAMWG